MAVGVVAFEVDADRGRRVGRSRDHASPQGTHGARRGGRRDALRVDGFFDGDRSIDKSIDRG